VSGCPGERAALADYLLGELPAEEERRLEEHLFSCEACTEALEDAHRIGAAVAAAARRGEVGAAVNAAYLERAARDGLTLRQYRIAEGETVLCKAGPEDLVVVRLAGAFGGADELDVEVRFEDLEGGTAAPPFTRTVVADRQLDEIVMVFPGEVVRAYPRSLWTMTVRSEDAGGRRELGPFVMDHTP